MIANHLPATVFALTLMLAPADASAALTAWTDVVVRVYDTADLPDEVRQHVLTVAHQTMVTASVEVTWLDCSTAVAPPEGCQAPRGRRELLLRLVRGPSTKYGGRLALGDALVEESGRPAALATVYVDRVRGLAEALRTDQARLLGRAIAHELGHLLLATTSHARHGLMRAAWSPEELRRERGADWRFSAADAALISAKWEVRSGK